MDLAGVDETAPEGATNYTAADVSPGGHGQVPQRSLLRGRDALALAALSAE